MKLKLKKKLHISDKSRKKIYTPVECLVPTVEGGFVVVYPKKESSVRALQRKGFEVVKNPVEVKKETKKVGPKPNESIKIKDKTEKVLLTRDALKDLTVKELLSIAKSLKVIGRHKMKEDELIKAIMIARSESE